MLFFNAVGFMMSCSIAGLEKLQPIQSPKFFPFVTKKSGEVANLRLIFTSALLKQKGYHLPMCCYFNKTKKEIMKLVCFLLRIKFFFQSEDMLIVA